MTDRLVTAAEVARVAGLSPSQVYSLAAQGRIPSFRFGRSLRFDLLAVLEAVRQPARDEALHNEPGGRLR